MASRNIKLPVVEPFELPDPEPSSAADGLADELEAALNTDLQILSVKLGGSNPADDGDQPPERRPTDAMSWDSQDPRAQRVVRRLDQARRPKPKAEAPPLGTRLADAHARGTGRFDSIQPQRLQPAAKPDLLASPARADAQSAAAPLPRLSSKRAVAAAQPATRQPAVTTSMAFDEEPFPDALHAVLRCRSMEEDLIAEAEARDRLRQRPRLGMLAIAAILLAGAGAGATVAFQVVSPHDPVATARGLDPAPVAILASATDTVAAPRSLAAAAPVVVAPPVEKQPAPSSQTATTTTRSFAAGSTDSKVGGGTQSPSAAARDFPASDGKPIKSAEPPARAAAAPAAPPATRTETSAIQAQPQTLAAPAAKSATEAPATATAPVTQRVPIAATSPATPAVTPPAATAAPAATAVAPAADMARAVTLVRPRPVNPPAAPPPAWLVEDDPATFEAAAARQQAAAALTNAAPSWFVEDDPATFETAKTSTAARTADAAGGRPRTGAEVTPPAAASLDRMVITSDVTARTAPDNQSNAVGVLKAGTVVAVGECKLWCEVTLAGKSGWVPRTVLSDPSVVATAH